MKCSSCDKTAVLKNPAYCKEHFCKYFEERVVNTIKNFKLIEKKDRVAVAASGGKDSLTVLSILHKYGYNVTAIAIDEGIKGYRDGTLDTLSKFCAKRDIPLEIASFKGFFGKSLDEILVKKNYRPCTVCGVFRRYLLNKSAKGFDVIATGHNMDDEAQAIFMNLIKGNVSLLKRQGPISGTSISKKFTRRVKPLYLCPEKEVMIYSFLFGLTTEFEECPNVNYAFRLRIRDMLNDLELQIPGCKKNLVNWFLDYKNKIKSKINVFDECCSVCGEPSHSNVCKACMFAEEIKEKNK